MSEEKYKAVINMTNEQKAKRYDEAIKVAKSNYETIVQMDSDCTFAKEGIINTFHRMFPELAESEDEKVRKALINGFKDYKGWDEEWFDGITVREAIAWLEKQGEQKPTEEYNITGISSNKSQGKLGEIIKNLKSVNEVEPKFKVGDWVVDKNGIVKQILSYKDCIYKHTDGYSSKMFEDEWRLWDITKDAKDGDVLVHNKCTFIFMGIKNGLVQALEENLLDGTKPVSFGDPTNKNNDYSPATKEQRDILIKAMADAGYTFDFEKKELIKIEQKPSWSEEDERIRQDIENFIHFALEDGSAVSPAATTTKEGAISWIQSLKGRYTWKPSDEQMDALETATSSLQSTALESLYNDLKKLL